VIVVHQGDPAGQCPGALNGVAGNAGQDLVGGPGPGQLCRRLSQSPCGPARGPGTSQILEDGHAMRTSGHIDGELGTDDFALGAVGTAQVAAERGRHLAGRIAELISEAGQQDRVLAGRDAAQEVPASQLLERVAQHLTRRRVGIDETPPGIDDGNPVLGAGQHAGQRGQAQRSGIRLRSRVNAAGGHTAALSRGPAFPRLPTARHRRFPGPTRRNPRSALDCCLGDRLTTPHLRHATKPGTTIRLHQSSLAASVRSPGRTALASRR